MVLLIVNDIVIEAKTMASDIPWDTCGIDQVFTAFSAGEARAVILANPVDILLCDIEMPDESGLSLIHWIRENQYDIDCILLTCHADFAYAREGISLGCQDYISLPAKYEDILASVRKVCLRHQKHQEDLRLQSYGKNWLANQMETLAENKEQEPHHTPAEISESCVQYILGHISDCDLSAADVAGSVYLNPTANASFILLSRCCGGSDSNSFINLWLIQYDASTSKPQSCPLPCILNSHNKFYILNRHD